MQDFFAILIVTIAAAFLASRAWRHVTKRAAGRCGSCANCSGSGTVTSQQFVAITPHQSSH
jgi:hypothetical protein